MAHVPVPTAQADSDLRHAIRQAITAGARVLVVGCPPGTFPYWMMQHPALLFWTASEAKASDDRRIVPPEVGVVLITKLLSHALERNVRHQANERKIVCPGGTLSPGAVQRVLDGIVMKPQKNGEDDMAKGPTHLVGASRPSLQPGDPTYSDTRDGAMDEQTAQLVSSIDDAIAAMQLVREQVITNSRQLAGIRGQLDALDALKRMLK